MLVYDLALAAKDKETFDAFFVQLEDEFPVKNKGNRYLGCAFER